MNIVSGFFLVGFLLLIASGFFFVGFLLLMAWGTFMVWKAAVKELPDAHSPAGRRERRLVLLAFLGGFWGLILGRFVFHRDGHSSGFWALVGMAGLLWIFGILFGLGP